MQRSSRSQSARRGASRSTARAARPATTNLLAVPDDGRRLADGVVVEASVVARLFRIRLLAIDASVVIAPADVTARRPVAVRSLPRAVPTRSHTIGPGLAAAGRIIDEGKACLAASRHPRR
jgi:hypothetical protein